MSTYYLTVPLEYIQGYYEITFSQLSPHYVGELKFIETGGSSASILNFSNLTQVDENTFTTTDDEGNTHTLVFTYNDDGNIKTATYDGKNVAITYDNSGNLIEVGNSDIDVLLYPDPKPSGNIGYQVTFKVEGNDYYMASCQQGESITEPPTPTKVGETFTAWQLNSVDITFPYTPSVDVELSAHFQAVRSEMEVYNAGTVISTSCTKLNDGLAIVGGSKYWNISGFWVNVSMLVAKTADAASMSSSATSGTITYEGETWYWSRGSGSGDFWLLDKNMSDSNLAEAILNHYFYKD